nr:hypothetical protein [Haladaptatus halobius]
MVIKLVDGFLADFVATIGNRFVVDIGGDLVSIRLVGTTCSISEDADRDPCVPGGVGDDGQLFVFDSVFRKRS